MVRHCIKALIISAGILATACGSSGGPNNIIETNEIHTKKSQVNSTDVTEKDDSPDAGTWKTKRFITMTMDYANSDGLQGFTRELSLKYGTGISMKFNASQTQSCAGGGAIVVEHELLKVVNYQQPDAKEESVQKLENGDVVTAQPGVYYFIRDHVNVSGQCTTFTSTTQVELHY